MSKPTTISSSRCSATFWLHIWWPVLAAITVIFLESTMMFGADHTSCPLHRLFEYIFGPISEENWESIHHFIRKTGHFAGYGLVGLSWLHAWWRTLPAASFFRCSLLALFGTFLVASCDEWHQSFLPNRTGAFSDVLLDCSGSLALLAISYLVLRIFRHRSLLLRSAVTKS